MAIRIGIIGIGEIATRRHLPAIAANPAFLLAGTAGPAGPTVATGVPHFSDYRDMLEAVDAVAVCTPPRVRAGIAEAVLAAGRHVLLEKPPAGTLGGLRRMQAAALAAGKTVFATWHSQFNPALDRARDLLAGQMVARLQMVWRENVHDYHPDQEWLWEPGGFGVFDAGINGFSVLTAILPAPLVVRSARLLMPTAAEAPGAQTPIAAYVTFEGGEQTAEMDWRSKHAERWIAIETTAGRRLRLTESGRKLEVDGKAEMASENAEYPAIYARFAELVADGRSEMDAAPLELVADAFLLGAREPS